VKDKVFVTKSSMPPIEEYIQEISSIWESHWMTNMGEKHNRLEQKLKDYLKADNISLFSNGHMALEMVLQAFQLKGEVITTPFTFASTTHAIVRNGLKPVFADIKQEDYTLDPAEIEKHITKDTTAIVPVHVYGNVCDVTAIEDIARRYHLKVIYDAAHAFGVEYQNKGIANYGDAAIFSFHATKVFNTIEGGAVCFRDEKIGTLLYQLKNFGIADEVTVNGVGANAKMNEFQAAMGLCNLRYLEQEIAKRKEAVLRYRERLNHIKGLTILGDFDTVKSNYAYFPVCVDAKTFGKSRDDIYKLLKKNNIFARKYFYPLTSDFDCYKTKFAQQDTPVARGIANSVLTLPLYSDLPISIVDQICDFIVKD